MYTFVVRDDRSSVFQALIDVIKQRKDWRQKSGDSVKANLIIGERNTLKFPFGRLGHDGILQLVNCYRGSGKISRKTALVSSLKSWQEATGENIFDWLPESYIIRPNSASNQEGLGESAAPVKTRPFLNRLPKADQREDFKAAHTSQRQNGGSAGHIWIAKASAGLKGEGILISDNCEELLSYVDNHTQAHVIQKYIENPLLLPGSRKFDIRCWVLLDHQYDIYLMKEGVLRTCAEPYQPEDLSNFVCHLTNHCIQEAHSADFGKYEEGNEMFFAEFDNILQENWQVSLQDKIWPQIKHIVQTCCLSVKAELVTTGLSYHSFQLFGFDFMLDTQFKVWLLEVNSAPACAQKLLDELICGMLAVAVDPLFPPQEVEPQIIGASSRVFQKL